MRVRKTFRPYTALLTAALFCLPCVAASLDLVESARNGDAKSVALLLGQNKDANKRSADGTTALHWAANRANLEMADALLRGGADSNAANEFGVTPLSLAAENGSAPLITLLLKAGSKPDLAGPTGETPLMTAARTGNAAAVSALLDGGANANAAEKVKEQTALMWAIDEGHSDVAKLLIERGANVHAKSKGGYTPFLFAVRAGNQSIVETMLAKGVNVNETLPARQGSALMLAILNKNYELAAYLLEKGADPNLAGGQGASLHALVRRGGGGDIDENDEGDTGTASGKMDRIALAELLVAKGADVNLRGIAPPRGKTASIATALRQLPRVQNPDTSGGETPFLSAAENADVPMMKFLLAKGADPRATSAHANALMLAAGVGNAPGANQEADVLEAVKICFDTGVDINGVDDNGDTAVHGAVLRGHDSVIRFLAAHGAKLSIRNRIGWTPLDIAEALLPGTPKYRPEHSAVVLRELTGVTPAR